MKRTGLYTALALFLFTVIAAVVSPQLAPGQSGAASPAQAPATVPSAYSPYRPVTRQVTEEIMLPSGRTQLVTREVVEHLVDDTTSATSTTGQSFTRSFTNRTDRLDNELHAAVEAFRNAEGVAKAEARRKLREALGSYFQRDFSRREAEVTRLEEQVRGLRAQLGRRREKQEEIIDLQMKLIENEAEGLGLFPEQNATGPRSFMSFGRRSQLETATGAASVNLPANRQGSERRVEEQPENAPAERAASLTELQLDETGLVPAFDFDGQGWPDVLNWYAKLVKRSLDWQTLPSGNVNIVTGRPSRVDEVRTLLNRRLNEYGFALEESEGVVRIHRIENGSSSKSGVIRRAAPR